MTDNHPTADTDGIGEGEAARDDLAGALKDAGIVLPSLGLDTPAYADYTPTPLIDLGRCNIDTARKLAAALRGGTGRAGAGQ